MTITDHYRADRDAAAREQAPREARNRVWRTYARAVIEELQRRSMQTLGGPVIRWRAAKGDDQLPIAWPGYWSRVSADDLMALYDALCRARYRGHQG